MPRPRLPILRPLVAVVALAGMGCKPEGVLVGPTGEHRMVARLPAHGITAVLTTGTWDGDPPDLAAYMTVVHLLVANTGARAVRLAPGDFELRSARGFRYRLLDAGGSFAVADENGRPAGYVPGRTAYPSGADPDYVELHASSRDVHAFALPWGHLQPGTDMRGFVYFEKAEDTANLLTLVWHAHDEAGAPLADVRFDLRTARPRRR